MRHRLELQFVAYLHFLMYIYVFPWNVYLVEAWFSVYI